MDLSEPRQVELHFNDGGSALLLASILSVGASDPRMAESGQLEWSAAGMVLQVHGGVLEGPDGQRYGVPVGTVLVTPEGIVRLHGAAAAAAGDDHS